jgi:hypothetical protein
MTALLAGRELARFGVDVVEDDELAGVVERRRPYTPVALSGVANPEVFLYPVEDHIADKLSAMGKIRWRGDIAVVSTRYRDAADLALLAESTPVRAEALSAALDAHTRHAARAAFGKTGLRPPGPEWPVRYAETMRLDPFVAARWPTLTSAFAAAKPLVDPVLRGQSRGIWRPDHRKWLPE